MFVSAAENKGIERNSLILCEQVTILPITKIINPNYGEVNEEIMEQVTKALQIQLGIFYIIFAYGRRIVTLHKLI